MQAVRQDGERVGGRVPGARIRHKHIHLSHFTLHDSSQAFLPTAPCCLNIIQLKLRHEYRSYSIFPRNLLEFTDFQHFMTSSGTVLDGLIDRYFSETNLYRKISTYIFRLKEDKMFSFI